MSISTHEMTPARGWFVVALLLLILLAGFALRIWHVDWADGQLPHPDERSTVAFYAPSIRWPSEGISPLDKRNSSLNPLWDVGSQQRRSYTYGHFPLYSLVLVAHGLHELAPLAERVGAPSELVNTLRTANGVPGFALVGRTLMAIADTFTVLLVFLLTDRIYAFGPGGRRWDRWWVGLLAAAFSAFTVLQIQLSHFFAVDPVSTTFTLLALYGALRIVEDHSAGWAVITGVGAGLAIASKFSALPILAAPVVAGFLIWWRGRRGEGERERGPVREGEAGIGGWRIVGLVGLALVVAAATFAITSPFAILDWENFSRAVLVEQGAMVRGEADLPFTRQYRGTPPYLYHIYQQIRWGMGWPMGILAFAGLAWVLVKLVLGRAKDGELITLSWIVPYFGLTGLFLAKFMRYMVPVVPLLVVFAAGLVAAIADWAVHRRDAPADGTSSPSPVRRWLAAAIAIVALLGAILWSLSYVNGIYNNTHPWIKASQWMYANIPDGSTVAWEQWDDSLPYDLPEPNSNRGRFRTIDWGPFEEDTAEKFERLKSTLRQADYISLASNRIYGAVDNLPERYPMTNRYYQLLFAGELGYELVLEQVNTPSLLGIGIDDRDADESFTLYDHPTVLVFRKVRDLSDAEWDQLLGGSWEGARPWYTGEPILIQRLWSLFRSDGVASIDEGEPEPGEGASLMLDQPLRELPLVNDFRWNDIASRSVPLAVMFWWLAVSIVGLLSWPLTFALFKNLRDRGYLLARSLGWLLIGYVVWLAASLRVARNSLVTIVVCLALLALVALLLWWRQRAAMATFLRAKKGFLLFCEALVAAAYLIFVLLRILNPDLWQPWNGGEKFMEFAFLNAILRSPNFPPIDPYFAGGTINYYYYGHYLVSLLTRLTGIWSSVAFNLAIPTLFALTVANVFSLGYNLAPRSQEDEDVATARIDVAAEGTSPGTVTPSSSSSSAWRGVGAGLVAAFFVAVLGNPEGGAQVVRNLAGLSSSAFASHLPGVQTAVRAAGGLARVLGPSTLPAYRYWDPSRVIPFTINEFPYWSFLFADLHPHMIGIPFTVLFLALAFNMLAGLDRRAKVPSADEGWRAWGAYALRGITGDGMYLALALVLGALAVINTWDLPTYYGLAVLVWLIREWRSGRLSQAPAPTVARTLLFAGGLLGLALLLYLPFFVNYEALASSGLGIVKSKTELDKWLNIWGFFGFLVATFVLLELARRPLSRLPRDLPFIRWLRLALDRWPQLPQLARMMPALSTAGALTVAAAIGVCGLLWMLGFKVPAVLLIPLLGAALLLLRRTATAENLYIAALMFAGLLVLIGVEFLYLKDHLQGGDWRRMNTLFKFYIQVWVMLGVAAAVAMPRIWRHIATHWKTLWRGMWSVMFAWLLLLSLVFPAVGTPARLDDRFPRENGRPPAGTLDGMAYMTTGRYTWHPDPALASSTPIDLRYDYEAIRWLLDNVEGVPTVAEALIGYYREGGLRVASFTGFPTLLGFHQEGEQRYGWQTGPRRGQAEELWRTADADRARQLIEELNIDYVYVGQLERIVYPPEAMAKFEQLSRSGDLEPVYSNDQVTIYRVER